MKNILVPYDFSSHAQSALKFAYQLASKSNGNITMLHVIDHPSASQLKTYGEIYAFDREENIYMLELIKRTKQKLSDVATDTKYGGVSINFKVSLGAPYESIGEEVAAIEADLIVMGTKGASGLQELFVGSNAEKVVRFSKCPVITIAEDFELEAIRNIAFATNFEDEGNFVLKEFVKYQELFDARLHLVWIDTIHAISLESESKENLRKFAETNNLKNFEVHVHKEVATDTGIIDFAANNDIDMIAMTTHGHRGLMHLFVGSVAENVVNHATLPVWTYSLKAVPEASTT